MLRTFTKINYEVLEKEFINSNNISFKNTAIVTFYDSNSTELAKEEMGFLDSEAIFKKIENKEDLNLNNCLIKDFSLDKYRKLSNLDEQKFVILREFSADNSLFFSDSEISFYRSNFIGKKAIFNNSIFLAPKLSLKNANLEKSDADFDYITFLVKDIDFQGAIFGDYDVSFKNAIFSKGTKNFEDVRFGKGELSFLNADFNEGNVNFSNVNFGDGRTTFRVARFGKGKKDFSRAKFGVGEVSFEKVEFGGDETSFRSAEFSDGKVDFTRCEFGNGKVIFTNTNFGNGNTTFTGSNFGDGKINFKLAEFGEGLVDFHFSKFGVCDLVFERTKFGNGGLDFRAVEFAEAEVKFNRIEFGNGDVIFEACEMHKGEMAFSFAVFGNGTFNFENAMFENADMMIEDVDFGQGKVSFKHSKFKTITLKSSQINNYFDLRVEKCGKLDLSNTIVKDILDISSFEFKLDIKELDLSGIRLLGRVYIDWKNTNVKELIYNQKTTLRNKSEQFRVLKENYHTIGMYDEEDAAYVEFKRTEALADLKDITNPLPNKKNVVKTNHILRKALAYIAYFFKQLVFDKMGLYATNPIRVLFSMLVVYFLFGTIFFIDNLIGVGSLIYAYPADGSNILTEFTRSYYFAAVTFLTIGYGDFYPIGFNRFIIALEGFSGVFMMSYFTVAFVRKILR